MEKFENSNFPKCQLSEVVVGMLYPNILHKYTGKVVESRDSKNRTYYYFQKCQNSKIQKFKNSKIQKFKNSKTQKFKNSIIQNSKIQQFKNSQFWNIEYFEKLKNSIYWKIQTLKILKNSIILNIVIFQNF